MRDRRDDLARHRRFRGLSQESLAAMIGVDRTTVARWERGQTDPYPVHREALCRALALSPEKLESLLAGWTRRQVVLPAVAVSPIILGFLTSPAMRRVDADPDLAGRLTAQVARAKALYQASRHQHALALLPGILSSVPDLSADDPRRTQAQVLAAHAYQLACSLMLKLGDPVLAALAAQRAMDAAYASEDPVAITMGSRAMVHSLMRSGHSQAAYVLGMQAIQQWPGKVNTASRVAVTRALLLRTAIAAARVADRHTAMHLLDRADRLTTQASDLWSGFEPVNVELHRVSVALILGDAAGALARANRIDAEAIRLSERRSRFFVDIALAHHRLGNSADALVSLEEADRVAPDEVRLRPQVRRLCANLAEVAAGPLKGRAARFAARIGAES